MGCTFQEEHDNEPGSAAQAPGTPASQVPGPRQKELQAGCEEPQGAADISHICLVSSGPGPAVPLSPQVQDLLAGTLAPGVLSRCFLAF